MDMNYIMCLLSMFPDGRVWPKVKGSGLYLLCVGMSREFVRINTRVNDALDEIFPPSAVEMLDEWEEVFGLPDTCIAASGVPQTIQARQKALTEKLFDTGGQDIAYYEAYAARYGFDITITETGPYEWAVSSSLYNITVFRAGRNTAGDALRQWENDSLECLFEEIKPAHTLVTYSYEGV